MEAAKADALLLECGDDVDQVPQRPRQAVDQNKVAACTTTTGTFENGRRLRDATEVDASQTPGLADSPSALSGDIPALVAVRGLLEEAVRRTADVSVIGRRVAAVLLDGAAEAAMATALAAFNDSPTERDNFDELRRRLVDHLHDAGRLEPGKKLDGWPEVRRLRLVRNGVQHHQIPPDHETLVGWTASVQRFVAHVIDAAYGLDVLAITAADAIGDEVIRSQFGEAERLIAAGEVAAGVKVLSGAFSDARQRWQEQHRRAMGVLQPVGYRDSLGIGQMIDSVTEPMAEMLEVAPFVADLGEYVWWQQLIHDVFNDRVFLNPEDGRRALSFVFTWIVRWEAFNATYARRQRQPYEPEPPPPLSTQPDGRPEVDLSRATKGVYATGRDSWGRDHTRYVLKVPYRTGSVADPPEQWLPYIDRALQRDEPQAPWKFASRRSGGWIHLNVDPEAFDADAILRELEERLRRVPEALAGAERAEARDRAARQKLVEEVDRHRPEVLAVSLPDGTPAYEKVEIRDDGLVYAYFTQELHQVVLREFFYGRDRATLPELTPGGVDGIGVHVNARDVDQLAALAARALKPILAVKGRSDALEAEAVTRGEVMGRQLDAALRRKERRSRRA
jgi:hypothetical protein